MKNEILVIMDLEQGTLSSQTNRKKVKSPNNNHSNGNNMGEYLVFVLLNQVSF